MNDKNDIDVKKNAAALALKNVSFSYKSTRVITDFSLSVAPGSFTTLLGASGCGKTTLLKLISGFLEPDSGEILIDGRNVCGIPAEKRNVGMVFQDYALFPHLTVAQNIMYGLKLLPREKGVTRSQFSEMNNALVHQTARILGLEGLLERYPNELSGGQQQRVALGRSLVLKPGVLLMDEPLSSLDAKLRAQVRDELREIQQKLKITTVYVTHDQEEALSLSDYVAVINKGTLLQCAAPEEMYFKPRDSFTAGFTGSANFILSPEDGASLVIRPEWTKLEAAPQEFSENNAVSSAGKPGFALYGTVAARSFFGTSVRYKIRLSGSDKFFISSVPALSDPSFSTGSLVKITVLHSWKLPSA
ncbi:ABC transporter ATP-binding protein [uncultured Treponema sp.]|uniref:ABC transporter ATP-binding protein n=1 Tax=uncultured Treponema sp. TaxID=162155 RepID=UPI0025976016|nr:ABC transporter ATP-binding protein [uncultured Treponema sp.]